MSTAPFSFPANRNFWCDEHETFNDGPNQLLSMAGTPSKT
jgi:hypothetical protein